MTLTVCVGASGSGKTTFLNDVHKQHNCTYIRQYHSLRPYIAISAIPNFDPTELPYWDIYIKERKDKSIIVGGTIGGQFMAGLSGGQRKMLLFELIYQRTSDQKNLLLVFDEPFAGVTDDFVPYIMERLNKMRMKHNILLVTNDHVKTLTKSADNTITVSAIDRSKVKVNGKDGVDRELAIQAMSIGEKYFHKMKNKDMELFRKVEFSKNGGLLNVFAYIIFAFGFFLFTFWNSKPGSEVLVLIAGGLISFFTMNPCFLQLVDWRISMEEEAEAHLHSSKSMNKFLKTCLAIFLLFSVSFIQFWCTDAVLGTLTSAKFFLGIFFDNLSLLIAIVCCGLYTNLSDPEVQILGAIPFLFMLFFSSTFSPGAGVVGLKGLRYLFPRFYLWCMVPGGMTIFMEGCPENNTLVYLITSSLLVPYLFTLWLVAKKLHTAVRDMLKQSSRHKSTTTVELAELQLVLFGEKALNNLKHTGSCHPGNLV